MTEAEAEDGAERRLHERYDTELSVDYSNGDTFLFAYITNISEMGIFIRSEDPAPIGTRLSLRFADGSGEPLSIGGEVVWVNPLRADGDNLNPGMGIRFEPLALDVRERVVSLVRAIAYLSNDDDAS
ncbi:MAG: PilZ domain-containing protein [Sandaracinaceae bacterium]|nr:PilZ domain-containing protein [Sandaracinaceae bacterium]